MITIKVIYKYIYTMRTKLISEPVCVCLSATTNRNDIVLQLLAHSSIARYLLLFDLAVTYGFINYVHKYVCIPFKNVQADL